MSREMLGTADDVVLCHSFNNGGCHGANGLRIITKGAQSNDRIVGVAVYIHHGRKCRIDTQGVEFTADDLSGLTEQVNDLLVVVPVARR